MSGFSRRDFLNLTGSAAVAAMSGRAACGDGTERQVRPRDQGRRRARSQPVAAGKTRHRHSLGHDRGDRERHPRRPRLEDHRCLGQTGDAGADRPALPTSIPMARRSAFPPTNWCSSRARPRWCRRAMPASTISARCAVTSWRNRARGFMPSSTSPTTACPDFPSPSSTTSIMRKSKPARWRWPKIRISCSASRSGCRRTSSPSTASSR